MFKSIIPLDYQVRPLPYPFLGAVSISNDIEFFDFDIFEILLKFLNTKEQTPLGIGLGLEVTSSFFFYSAHPYTFSYFRGIDLSAKLSHVAARINDYLCSGWIDTNHAYGDFDFVGGFTRKHALKCYETLSKLGVTLKTFTNHGSKENIQNIGKDASYHGGDLEASPAYHADLMKQHGVRYIWTDSLIDKKENQKSRTLKKAIKHFFKKDSQPKEILQDSVLQDNSCFKGFRRFRSTGANAPNFSSLGYQIKQINWKDFYSKNGAMIFYQHLGVLYRAGGKCYSTTLEALNSRSDVFLAPFYFLEQEHKLGNLWVCGLTKFLNYLEMIKAVKVQANEDNYNILYPEKIEEPEIFFQGLTIYTNPQKPIRIYYRDREIPIWHNGPDCTGKYSVTIPLKRLQEIW